MEWKSRAALALVLEAASQAIEQAERREELLENHEPSVRSQRSLAWRFKTDVGNRANGSGNLASAQLHRR